MGAGWGPPCGMSAREMGAAVTISDCYYGRSGDEGAAPPVRTSGDGDPADHGVNRKAVTREVPPSATSTA